MSAQVRYVVITPVRNEKKYIQETVRSVVMQTVRPEEWIIVDDGSADGTSELIDECAEKYPWIQPVHRKDRGFRKAGGGVVEAFYDGYSSLKSKDWEFIVKLDGDLSFESDYFEKCFEQFRCDPSLGVAGGMVYHENNGSLVLERQPMFHVRGATKIYRKECWEAIGGLVMAPGWDTLDEAKANMLGWRTQSLSELKIVHHRFTGAADGTWKNSVKNGMANYISGYHPFFMFFKCIRRLLRKPYILGSIGLIYGFLSGYVKRIPQVDDDTLITFIRQQQVRRLLLKPSMWR